MKERNLKEELKAAGLTQARFAEITDMPKRTIENWCMGVRRTPGIAFMFLDLWLDKNQIKCH